MALICLFVCEFAYSQVELIVEEEGVTINNLNSQSAEATAIFDVGSQSKGVVFPRLNLSQRNDIENPVEGLMLYNLTLNTYEFYNGTEWVAMGGFSQYNIPPVPENLSANAISYNQIDLTWNSSASDPVQFIIERRIATGTFQQIAIVAAGNYSYSDLNGLLGSTEYFYRVKASYGADSDYTVEVSVTTSNQILTYNIGTISGRVAPSLIFEHGGNYSSYPNAVGLYPLATNQVKYMEKSYVYNDNWRKWKIFAAGSLSNSKVIFYDKVTNNQVGEIELSYNQIAANSFEAEFMLPATITDDFILRIQETSDNGAQLYQITNMVQEGL